MRSKDTVAVRCQEDRLKHVKWYDSTNIFSDVKVSWFGRAGQRGTSHEEESREKSGSQRGSERGGVGWDEEVKGMEYGKG